MQVVLEFVLVHTKDDLDYMLARQENHLDRQDSYVERQPMLLSGQTCRIPAVGRHADDLGA